MTCRFSPKLEPKARQQVCHQNLVPSQSHALPLLCCDIDQLCPPSMHWELYKIAAQHQTREQPHPASLFGVIVRLLLYTATWGHIPCWIADSLLSWRGRVKCANLVNGQGLLGVRDVCLFLQPEMLGIKGDMDCT